jgi:hypothetical protein
MMDVEKLVEEVARALCAADGLIWEDQADPLRSGSGDDNQAAYRNAARSAILATLRGVRELDVAVPATNAMIPSLRSRSEYAKLNAWIAGVDHLIKTVEG